MRLLQCVLVAHHVSFDGQVPSVDLHLPCYDESVFGVCPLGVEVLEFVDGRVVEWFDGEGFLHGAFDEAVRKDQTAREGQWLGDQVSCTHLWRLHHADIAG